MFQTNYGLYMDPAAAGLKADLGFDDTITCINDDRANDGHFVTLGSGESKCKMPAAATDVTNLQLGRGIVVRSLSRVNNQSDGLLPGFAAGCAVGVMRRGRIWVVVEEAITVGVSGVHIRYAGTGNKGAFRGAAVTNETAQLPDTVAKWVKGSTGAGLALLEVNL